MDRENGKILFFVVQVHTLTVILSCKKVESLFFFTLRNEEMNNMSSGG